MMEVIPNVNSLAEKNIISSFQKAEVVFLVCWNTIYLFVKKANVVAMIKDVTFAICVTF